MPARLDFGIGGEVPDEESSRRLESMVAQQAAFRVHGSGMSDEDIASSPTLSDSEKRKLLQKALNMAASNGDLSRLRKLLEGKTAHLIDVNVPDDEGASPLIYASCFVSAPLSGESPV